MSTDRNVFGLKRHKNQALKNIIDYRTDPKQTLHSYFLNVCINCVLMNEIPKRFLLAETAAETKIFSQIMATKTACNTLNS